MPGKSQEGNEDGEKGEWVQHSALWFEVNWSVVSRQWAKAESDGGAWALFDVVSGQYDMLSQGKYQLSCQVME